MNGGNRFLFFEFFTVICLQEGVGWGNIKGKKKHTNFFNIFFLPTPKTSHSWRPKKKVYAPKFLGKNVENDPHKRFWGDLGGQKRGPKRATFGH